MACGVIPVDRLTSDRFYRRWIVANGWSESIGLGSTFVLGRFMATHIDANPSPGAAIVAFVLAVILGTVLEGFLVGMAQENVLRGRFLQLQPWRWTAATAIGAGLAWALGMTPSTMAAIVYPDMSISPATETHEALRLPLAAALGFITGPILGAAQWIVLRDCVHGAWGWLAQTQRRGRLGCQ